MTATPAPNSLVIDGLDVRMAGRRLFVVSAEVPEGAVLTVMGPSGSGKTTLLSILAGFPGDAARVAGRVSLGAEDLLALPARRRGAGLLFQDALLYPHLSVGENVAFAIPLGGTRTTRLARAEAALEDMGLAGFAGRDPATLSGGQKARVALARMLASAPRYLLLDEPFANLDRGLREKIRSLVFASARTRNLPVVLATHDEQDAEAAGGAVIRLRSHDREED